MLAAITDCLNKKKEQLYSLNQKYTLNMGDRQVERIQVKKISHAKCKHKKANVVLDKVDFKVKTIKKQ
jgi:hypothetical protein